LRAALDRHRLIPVVAFAAVFQCRPAAFARAMFAVSASQNAPCYHA